MRWTVYLKINQLTDFCCRILLIPIFKNTLVTTYSSVNWRYQITFSYGPHVYNSVKFTNWRLINFLFDQWLTCENLQCSALYWWRQQWTVCRLNSCRTRRNRNISDGKASRSLSECGPESVSGRHNTSPKYSTKHYSVYLLFISKFLHLPSNLLRNKGCHRGHRMAFLASLLHNDGMWSILCDTAGPSPCNRCFLQLSTKKSP